jgi:DNA-binding NarL/FixJ family response regulator
LVATGRPASSFIRVLIADDHALVREGLLAILRGQADLRVVAEAASGDDAVRLWSVHHPDITLMDLRMPGLDGLQALQAVRAQDASARVILLTAYDNDEYVYRGMRAGARAYLVKSLCPDELVRCIRQVQAGEVVLPPCIAAKLAGRVGSHELTDRETEVLRLLARGQSNKEIASTLFIGETTVKSHLKRLFAKLSVMSRTEAVAAASQRGLVQLG